MFFQSGKHQPNQSLFHRVIDQSLFTRVSNEYDAAILSGVSQSNLVNRFGCSSRFWFKEHFAPPYNWMTPEARDEQFRTYMAASSNELIVRLERDHREHAFPTEGERLELIPYGSGYPVSVLVEGVLLPPRKNPKTAILIIKHL
jgi:hypothetical protein